MTQSFKWILWGKSDANIWNLARQLDYWGLKSHRSTVTISHRICFQPVKICLDQWLKQAPATGRGLTVMKARGDGKLVAVNKGTKGFFILATGFVRVFLNTSTHSSSPWDSESQVFFPLPFTLHTLHLMCQVKKCCCPSSWGATLQI